MGEDLRTYCLLMRIASATERSRALTTMKTYAGLVDRWAVERDAVCHADNGYLTVFLIQTALNAAQMQAQFRNAAGIGPDDALLILETASDFAGAGFSRTWTWLQRLERDRRSSPP